MPNDNFGGILKQKYVDIGNNIHRKASHETEYYERRRANTEK